MEKQRQGTVMFETILVMGRDFLPPEYRETTGFFDYALSVEAYFDTAPRKRIVVLINGVEKKEKVKEGTKVNYHWSGHFNLTQSRTRVHLHNPEGDVGLYKLEAKLKLLRQHLNTFLSEHKTRSKKPAKDELIVKKWLNEGETHFTGHVTYKLDRRGNGHFAFADCHRALHWWVDLYHDEDGKPDKHSYEYVGKTLKTLETIGKGIDKSLKGIEDLRKFFERELEDENKVKAKVV